MADALSPWKRFLAAPSDTRGKTIGMAMLVSALSALAVSTAAVFLGPLAEANRAEEREARLAAMMAEIPGLAELLEAAGADTMDALIVDLTSDAVAEDVDPGTYDGTSPTFTTLAPEEDIAGLAERPDILRLYVLREDGAPQLVILPVVGKGYQSTIRGFLALEGDMETVAGLSITEQGETPGLGANIQTPAWQALWPGTSLVNGDGEIAVEVAKGQARETWQVDGITGATRTGQGVTNMIRFWVGEDGFGPILDKLENGEL